jgi:hypothetical protein
MAGRAVHPDAGWQFIQAAEGAPAYGRALDSRAKDLVTLLREEGDQPPEMLRAEPPRFIPHGSASNRQEE